MLCGSFDRIIMLVFALIELIALSVMLSEGGSAMKNIEDHATSAPVAGDAADPEERLRRLVGNSIGCGVFALIALLAITTYYTTSGLLLWLGRRVDVVRADPSAHRQMRLAPTSGVRGMFRIALKLINITVGVLGIVAITISASLFGVAAWQVDEVTWGDVMHSKETVDSLHTAMSMAVLALVMKILEAFLGHVWAINLSDARDYASTVRDSELIPVDAKSQV